MRRAEGGAEPRPDHDEERGPIEDERRFVVCRRVGGGAGPSFDGLSRGFASFEQALAACPGIAARSGVDLDEVIVIEIHEFWDSF